MTSEEARRILQRPRRDGTVGPWRVGDTIETAEQASLLQGILDGHLQVTDTRASAAELHALGMSLIETAIAQGHLDMARSKARVDLLKAAASLAAAGDQEGHDRVLAEVRRQQKDSA